MTEDPAPEPGRPGQAGDISCLESSSLYQLVNGGAGSSSSAKSGIMNNISVCFVNLKDKEYAHELAQMVRDLGGKIKKEPIKSTHVILQSVKGPKYKMASTLGLPLLSIEWVQACWDHRSDPKFNPNDSEILEKFKIKPFSGLKLALFGFDDEEASEMKDLTIKNGGEIGEIGDPRLSHIIINAVRGQPSDVELPDEYETSKNSCLHVVYKEWFWVSIQMAARADEMSAEHVYPLKSVVKNRDSSSYSGVPRGSTDFLSPGMLSMSGYDTSGTANLETDSSIRKTPDYDSYSKRRKICIELLDTERSYLHVLETIINVFHVPLKNPDMTGKPLLDDIEMNNIFGHIDPILQIHKKICQQLEQMIEKSWKETNQIGKIYVDITSDIIKAYRPFVNYFEDTKKTLKDCDLKYPRFHAFLKRCESRPECRRQRLEDLLITPIQHLPRIKILLEQLLQKTDQNNPDHKLIAQALEKIKQALNSINENKRKTEKQVAMFDIMNEIEDCPPTLLSAQRKYICRVNVKLITDYECGPNGSGPCLEKTSYLTLFLFNDIIEICKNRSLKRSNSLNTKPSSAKLATPQSSNKKTYRHLEQIRNDDIKRVHTVDGTGLGDALCIVSLMNTEFVMIPLIIEDEQISRESFMKELIGVLGKNEDDIDSIKPLDIKFNYSKQLASALHRSKLSLQGTRNTISRVWNRRQSNIIPANSVNNLFTPPCPPDTAPCSPKHGRRLTHQLSRFMSPLTGKINTTPLSRSTFRGSTQSLYEEPELTHHKEVAFNVPTTPLAKKKKVPSVNGSKIPVLAEKKLNENA